MKQSIRPKVTQVENVLSEGEIRSLLQHRVGIQDYAKISVARVFGNIAFQWTVIALALGGAVWSGHPLAYVAAMLIVVSRQHALGIIMHDATHSAC